MAIKSLALILVAAMAGTACGDLFEVQNPTNLTQEDLEASGLLAAIANTSEGAVCDAYDGLVVNNGLQSDDFTFIGSFTFTETFMWGSMEGFNSTYNAIYNAVASSRWVSDDMILRLEAALPSAASDIRVGRALFWNAIARIALAEHFEEVPIDGGAPLAPDVILEGTLAILDRVAQIAGGAGDKALEAAAHGTKARVYRSLYFERGQAALMTSAMTAATQALAVQSDFKYECRYAAPGSENTMANLWISLTGIVIDPLTAALVDPVSGLADPRIDVGPAEFAAPAPHLGSVHRYFKYSSRDSFLPVSRWQEMRLILAEGYLLGGGTLAQAVAEINLVRAAAGLTTPFASTVTADIQQQIIYERRAEFVGEGRRLQDHRYYDILPWQWIGASIALGTDRRWPVSTEEIAGNRNYSGG